MLTNGPPRNQVSDNQENWHFFKIDGEAMDLKLAFLKILTQEFITVLRNLRFLSEREYITWQRISE